MFKKFVFSLLFVILAVALLFGIWLLTIFIRPQMPSAEEIRDQLLVETPIGTHKDEVRVFIEQHDHWQIIVERFEEGSDISEHYRLARSDWSANDLSIETVVLDIEVDMEMREGVYMNDHSSAIWRFDEAGILVDIVTFVTPHNRWY